MSDKTIYLVTSLPRTGTTSLCKMANICNLQSVHVLKNDSFYSYIARGYNFFADTPFYIPEFLICILESFPNLKFKFIYSHKNEDALIASLQKLKNKWNPLNKPINSKIRLLDSLAYNLLEDNIYIKNHFSKIELITKIYNIDMLSYRFHDGWAPFCEFTKTIMPIVSIPHLNENP